MSSLTLSSEYVSPQPADEEGTDEEDFIPVHMLTEEIPDTM